MRHVFETMGTVASVEVPPEFSQTLPLIEGVLSAVDERFSLYRPDSELSRIARGELALLDASVTLRHSYARALTWRDATAGLFSVHRPDGVLDLNGIVKAEAIEQAAAELRDAGCRAFTLNVGGDILVAGDSEQWPTGIVDPHDRTALVASVELGGSRCSMATSGSAERGDHIWRSGQLAPAEYVQVSVIAEDIVTADVLATAIIAGGHDALDDFTERYRIDVLTIDRQGALTATPYFRALLKSLSGSVTT